MAVSVENLPDDAREAVKLVVAAFEKGKDRHEATRRKAERFYKLYRSYKELKRTHADSSNGQDVVREAMHGFGADLFIPYVFSVIETTLPRMLSGNPRMTGRPAIARSMDEVERVEGNIENMKLLLERQQEKFGYSLVLQDIAKAGLMSGLGFQKILWDERYRDARHIARPTIVEEGSPEFVIGGLDEQGQPTKKLVYEGPVAEWVDLFDLIWDPRGWHFEVGRAGCCRWAIHRMWMDDDEVKERLETGKWELPQGVDLEDVLSGGGSDERTALLADRLAAAGLSPENQSDKQHEIWEFHDGNQVIVIVDRQCPVQAGPNPHWHGELPFQAWRPTRIPGEMMGIGEAEAIEDLQEEMNILRAQRRDNAAIVLQRPFAYFEGLVDVAEFEWGAGVGLGVDGNPNDLLTFFPVDDLPHSGYQEEANLQRDIERVTGIDDTTSGGEGGGGASETATGVQLVQRAAGIRIANKTALLSLEVVKPGAGQMVLLNQQKIVSSFFIPGPPKPGDAHKSWSWYQMGPEELAGEFELVPDDESMMPDNPAEKLEKATRLWTMFSQDPLVDPMWVREQTLEYLGVENPKSKLIDPMQEITPEELEMAAVGIAEDLGLPEDVVLEVIRARVQEAQALSMQMEQEGSAEGGEQPPQEGPPQ